MRCALAEQKIMRKTSITFSSVCFFAVCFLMAGCQEHNAPAPSAKATPKSSAIKKVEITIEPVKPSFSHTISTSFEVEPTSQANVEIQWDGHKFTSKTDSGATFLDYAPSVAFEKQQTVDFKVKKKVTITKPDGSVTTTSSETVSLKRGIPKKL